METKKREEKNFWQKMSFFEKSFWTTLLILFSFVGVLSLLGQNNLEEFGTHKTIIETKEIEKILLKSQDKLNISLKDNLKSLQLSIDTEIDKAFDYADNHIENYLDWHYSVVGEYTMLGAAATGSLERKIKNKLLGGEFTKTITRANANIAKQYSVSLDEYYTDFKKVALSGVDGELNTEALKRVDIDTSSFLKLQEVKVGLGAVMGASLITKIASRIAAKSFTKIVVKSSAKMATKILSSSAAAATGLTCGPLAWICAPIAAGVTWLSVDYIFVTVDEVRSRAAMRQEVIAILKREKLSLKNEYKKFYLAEFKRVNEALITRYKKVKTKKTIRESIWQ